MSEIRMLSAEEIDDFARIFMNAYPGMRVVSEEDRERLKQRLTALHDEPTAALYGLFRQGQLLGGMCCHDFTMNFLHVRMAAGGVGHVAVDLLHKKAHVAKEMMAYFLRHCRERGAPIAMLYPFRPDFYRQMGFGYGTKMNQYRVKPAALPKGPSKAHVRYLDQHDRRALWDCCARFVRRTHGMIEKSELELTWLVERPQNRIVGYEEDGQVRGYVVFTFEHGEDFLTNDIHVREFVYDSQVALSELLTFLHTQADQIRTIVFDTQDEFFHYVLLDPRSGSAPLIPHVYHQSNLQGVGIMYRVMDISRVFALLSERDFGGQTCRVRLTVEDSFVPENAGSILLRFEEGRLHLMDGGGCDVEVYIDVAEFSSLLAGAVNFRSLVKYGLADVSDPGYVSIVDKIFAVKDKPVCTTPF